MDTLKQLTTVIQESLMTLMTAVWGFVRSWMDAFETTTKKKGSASWSEVSCRLSSFWYIGYIWSKISLMIVSLLRSMTHWTVGERRILLLQFFPLWLLLLGEEWNCTCAEWAFSDSTFFFVFGWTWAAQIWLIIWNIGLALLELKSKHLTRLVLDLEDALAMWSQCVFVFLGRSWKTEQTWVSNSAAGLASTIRQQHYQIGAHWKNHVFVFTGSWHPIWFAGFVRDTELLIDWPTREEHRGLNWPDWLGEMKN